MTAAGTAALAAAMRSQGLPYLWGGTGPAGYDCSGLTQSAWKSAGVSLPRTSQEQRNAGTVIPLAQAQPGDLVLFSYPGEYSNPAPANHVGLYVNPNTVFAASEPGIPIGFAPMDLQHLDRVVRPGGLAAPADSGGAIEGGGGTVGGSGTGAVFEPVSDAPAAQLAGYQAVLNLTPWGIPLNPLKLPGYLAGKLGSLAGQAGEDIWKGVVTGIVDALGPLLLTITIAGAGLALIGLGVWRAVRPARDAAAQQAQQLAPLAMAAA